jgi:hypothetical protein
MPPVKDFREIKLKSQVIASILLFLLFETVAVKGYAGTTPRYFEA